MIERTVICEFLALENDVYRLSRRRRKCGKEEEEEGEEEEEEEEKAGMRGRRSGRPTYAHNI